MILISNDFLHKRKMYNCDPYNVLLSIVTYMLLMTASVLQGHIKQDYLFIKTGKYSKSLLLMSKSSDYRVISTLSCSDIKILQIRSKTKPNAVLEYGKPVKQSSIFPTQRNTKKI